MYLRECIIGSTLKTFMFLSHFIYCELTIWLKCLLYNLMLFSMTLSLFLSVVELELRNLEELQKRQKEIEEENKKKKQIINETISQR